MGSNDGTVNPGGVTFTVMPTGQVVWSPGYTATNSMEAFVLAVTAPEVEDPEVEDPEVETETFAEIPWEGVLAVEGSPTDDGRYLLPGEISEREMPLTLMAQFETDDGHDGALVAGRIDRTWRVAAPMISPNAMLIMGAGVFAPTEDGARAASLVEGNYLRGVSIDFAPSKFVPIDRNTLEPVAEEDVTMEAVMNGDILTGMAGVIMGATICPFPAFADAYVKVLSADRVLIASAGTITLTTERTPEALTASAAGMTPDAPPRAWFETPEADRLTPLTVTDDGHVYGHLADWNTCHTGSSNACQLAPRSPSGYRHFHLGEVLTAEGDRVAVGKLVVGKQDVGRHAPLSLNARETERYYDRTSEVAAFVRATDGRHGIWLTGAVRPGCPAEKVVEMMANPPSGDWRARDGSLELVMALSVVVPGFPIPRAEYAMVASGASEEMTALVATAAIAPTWSRAEQRRKSVLTAKARTALRRE